MEEEDEDEGHVHGDDGDHHQHAAVQGGHHPAIGIIVIALLF